MRQGAGNFEGQAAEERFCGLKSALLSGFHRIRFMGRGSLVFFTATPGSSPGTVKLLLLCLVACWLAGCGKDRSSVVVYTSQDQVYAEPILREFSRRTGLEAKAVYDSEAVKTVGLANRLLAERSNPQCDVFWNNEELRTRQLEAQDVFRSSNAWVAVGFRTRRLVINTNRLALAAAPRRLAELTNAVWRGKVALAYPLFGTTATHFLALRQQWGDASWQNWCRALQDNRPLLVDGNSLVARLVAHGEAWIGLTDSDDIAAQQREGSPVAALPLTAETLWMPNTVAVIRRAPHPEAAQELFEYLQSPEVLEQLVAANALEGASPDPAAPSRLPVNWAKLLGDLNEATDHLRRIFLR